MEWFVCKNCLWWKKLSTSEVVGKCKHIDLREENMIYDNDVCNNWTCKNCWQSWESYAYEKDSDELFYIDHSKCESIKFK